MWNIYCENSCAVGMWSVDGAAVVVRTVPGVGRPQDSLKTVKSDAVVNGARKNPA